MTNKKFKQIKTHRRAPVEGEKPLHLEGGINKMIGEFTKSMHEAENKLEEISKLAGTGLESLGYLYDFIDFRAEQVGHAQAIKDYINRYMTNHSMAGLLHFLWSTPKANTYEISDEEFEGIKAFYKEKANERNI